MKWRDFSDDNFTKFIVFSDSYAWSEVFNYKDLGHAFNFIYGNFIVLYNLCFLKTNVKMFDANKNLKWSSMDIKKIMYNYEKFTYTIFFISFLYYYYKKDTK